MSWSRRRVLFWTKVFFGLWIVILVYLYFTLDNLPTPWGHNDLSTSVLASVMSKVNSSFYRPLTDLVIPQWYMLSFYHLAKRHRGILYTEVTSANRDTSYPLAPDFTFHVDYQSNQVTLYEDYGPGCVHRVFLFPVLPTHVDILYKMTSKNLTDSYIIFDVDDTEYKYSLELFMDGEKWPFLRPFNTQHRVLASGMGSYTPICYQQSLKIIYITNQKLPQNLLELTINCSKFDLQCPIHIYSSVSRTKFPSDMQVESFTEEDQKYRKRAENVATLLKAPENNGPDSQSSCRLQCMEMCKDCHRVLFSHHGPGVISSIKLRVFETATGRMRSNWTDILVSAVFDKALSPQVDKVPLGSLFGVTASLNTLDGAVLGSKRKHCDYADDMVNLPKLAMTGYLYYPMPFWKNAEIMLEGTEYIDTPLLVCHEIHVVNNFYDLSDTGYFNAKKTYYSDNVTGWREVLKLQGSWGQVVGLLMEVDNLRAYRGGSVNDRWAPLQSDAVVFLDDNRAANVLGTGLEDYFSYSHGFNMAENTTYAFVGNYHSAPRQNEPLTWHCYRFHVLDPIFFHHSIHFVMEGMSKRDFQSRQPSLSYNEWISRKRLGAGCLSHLVLYYTGRRSGFTPTDKLQFSHDISEQEHRFEIVKLASQSSGRAFHLANKRYLGACNNNHSISVSGRAFTQGDKFTFTLTCQPINQGVILRREFHSIPIVSWNEKANIWVNKRYVGVWFIPMGVLSTEYSIRQEDFSIGSSYSQDNNELEITIEPLTLWRDISYKLLTIN